MLRVGVEADQRLDKNREVLADPVFEIMSGGMVIGRALAKSSAYGECPPG
jgi:hypothetical protein